MKIAKALTILALVTCALAHEPFARTSSGADVVLEGQPPPAGPPNWRERVGRKRSAKVPISAIAAESPYLGT